MSEQGNFLPIKDEDGNEMYISIPKSTFTPTEKDFAKGNDKFQPLPKYIANRIMHKIQKIIQL